MESNPRYSFHPYGLMLLVYAIFFAAAFVLDSPARISRGLWQIVTSRGVLITDYMAVGGIGATLMNAAMVGSFGILMLVALGVTPNGSIIMALWLTAGFAMFGKNLFNMMPLTFGVWLYSRLKREPFSSYSLVALLSATLSPVVSGICFHPDLPAAVRFPLGIGMGILAGFIFPAVSSYTMRVHNGYVLYNMGFAGGLISTFIVSGLESVGVGMPRELLWSSGNDLQLAILLYLISATLMVLGLFPGGRFHFPGYRRLVRHSGRMVSDYYTMFGDSIYFNMGILGAVSTTVMLLFGASLNGATLCGIFTIMGFGAFGKHLRNVLPVLVGAMICSYVNLWDPTEPSNTLAILFSTGLAPVSGQFGWGWGLITGFLHVNTIMHIGFLNSGLNLYNNGYAAGFVALLLVPVITALRSAWRRSREEATADPPGKENAE